MSCEAPPILWNLNGTICMQFFQKCILLSASISGKGDIVPPPLLPRPWPFLPSYQKMLKGAKKSYKVSERVFFLCFEKFQNMPESIVCRRVTKISLIFSKVTTCFKVILIWQRPDQSGSCLIFIRQRLTDQAVA